MTTRSILHSTNDDRTRDVADVLTELGVEIKHTRGEEIVGRCPVHHRHKGRPSTRADSWGLNSESGLWHCWTCGARGNLHQLISSLSDDPRILWTMQRTLIHRGLERQTAEYTPERYSTVDWTDYARFAPLPPQIIEARNLSETEARRFGIRWDTENKAIIIPIVSASGELLGWQEKKSKWFRNYPEGVRKGSTFFGIERAFESTCLLLESPLDVVRFHSVYSGPISAIAAFGAVISKDQKRLLIDKFDQVILALDNDETGRLAASKLYAELPSFRHGVKFWKYENPLYKDLGEMPDDMIMRGVSAPTSIPPRT